MSIDSLPYLTHDIPGVPGAIKRDYEDFRVEEIPAYEPCGRGDHVYFTIEKAGLATMQAVNDIARALGVGPREIGVAGLKDARAVTRQLLSLEHADPERIRRLELPRLRVVDVSRHTNKLRIGHLHGNRFVIRLRETDPARIGDVRSTLDILTTRGVPNYFGAQRFGSRGDTGDIGRAVIKRDADTVIALMCGRPGPADSGEVRTARELFEAGDYEAAAKAWPYMFRDNRRVSLAMAKSDGNARKAMHAIDRNLMKFYISAFQSQLFNAVLAERIGSLDRLLTGDLAMKHSNGAVFRVEDAAAEQPRAERFEVSPTGPLFGHRMTEPGGEPQAAESRVLKEAGVGLDEFGGFGPLSAPGGRRALRFQPVDPRAEAGRDERGEYIELRFTLGAGCYATMVLREICKAEMDEGREE